MPRKIKQKQKQSQRQSVVVNIHEKKAKKRRPHRKKEPVEGSMPPPVVLGLPKVPPIVVQYTPPASLIPTPEAAPPQPQAQPARQPERPVAARQAGQAAAARQIFIQPVREGFVPPAGSLFEPISSSPAVSEISQAPSSKFQSPPRSEELQQRIPSSFQDITGQAPPLETLSESLPPQVAAGGGVRRERRPPVHVYPYRNTIIREIVRATDSFSVEDLKQKDTKVLREIYDSLGLPRK